MSFKFGLNVSHHASWPPVMAFDALRCWWNDGTSWANIEVTKDNFNWTSLDRWVNDSLALGIKDILYTFGRVPVWAGGGLDCKNPPSDISTGNAQWKEFVKACVLRYKGRITAYELWNEPDNYWKGTAGQMVTMAKDAFTIIKLNDPAAIVTTPSPSTANQFGVHFLPDYFAAGGVPYCDVVACHFYQYDNHGKPVRSPNGWLQTSVVQLKKLMAQYGLTGKPIWYTEGSWNRMASFTVPLSKTEQVAWLTQAYSILQAGGVDRGYWYAYDVFDYAPLIDPNLKTLTVTGHAFALVQQGVPITV